MEIYGDVFSFIQFFSDEDVLKVVRLLSFECLTILKIRMINYNNQEIIVKR